MRLRRVDLQINRLTQIVRDLLDISRIQAGKLEMTFTQLDLIEIVRQVCETMQMTTAKHTIRFNYEGVTTLIVNGDPERLEQLFTNLISNAIKYSPEGGMVDVEVQRIGDEARIKVRDFGIGIPAEDRAKLFERFHRASNISRHRITGFGIGLYISREIVQAHGGRIWLDDTTLPRDETLDPEACGSLFCVAMPLA
jgi:signal transduction histidine kinase